MTNSSRRPQDTGTKETVEGKVIGARMPLGQSGENAIFEQIILRKYVF